MIKTPKLYDLTQPLYHNSPGWPDHDLPVVTKAHRIIPHGFNQERLSFLNHSGTHVDAPGHFLADGKTVDKIALDTFAGPGVFLDLRPLEPDTPITAAMLKPFLPRIAPGDMVLLNTGWFAKRGFTDEYLRKWPYLDGSGAKLLADAEVKAVGIDGLSMGGYGTAEKAVPCHQILLSKEVLLIEELYFPEAVMDGKKRYITAFPLLTPGCNGGPARVIAHEF
ncbi:cyclase [Deltaproteobacteria bacterium]|nr:cyclase [Deltaproteobacteria bacterium]